MPLPPDPATRVVVQQLSLRRYRVPVLRELASRPGLRVKLVIGEIEEEWMGRGAPEGFELEHMRSRTHRIGEFAIRWHRAQWHYATRKRCDVLVLSWDLHYLTLIPALLRARLNRLPTVLWGHGFSKREKGWRRWLRDGVARLGTAVLFYDHTTAKRFLDDGWDPKRVYVALNSLDQHPIEKSREDWLSRPHDLERFRREHDLDEGPVVLFVSRLMEKNRTELLLQAAARVRGEFPTMRVVIVGDGPDMARLKRMANELGVDDITQFPGAIFGEDKLAPWFLSVATAKRGGAYCYPTHVGLSLLHAFGYGLPVITTERRSAHGPEIEALEPGRNGLFYADESVEDLASTLAELLRDRDMQRRLGEGALETVRTRFNVESMVDGMEAAVRYAASTKRAPASPAHTARPSRCDHG